MSEKSFLTRLIGAGYCNAVTLRFNPDDEAALAELDVQYRDLRQDPNFDCAYLDVTCAWFDAWAPTRKPADCSQKANDVAEKINDAAVFCDWK